VAQNNGVPGEGVTPLVGGLPVTQSNPLPVSSGGGFPAAVGGQLQTVFTGFAAGDNTIVAAVAGKRIFVTGYNFSYPAGSADSMFKSGALTQISARGMNVLGGAEAIGGEPYLFNTAAGEALVFNISAAKATGNVQVRYRVEA
jgi:hypothetical protein